MAALTKNAISLMVRDRAKRTKILDHKGYKQVPERSINSSSRRSNQLLHFLRLTLSNSKEPIQHDWFPYHKQCHTYHQSYNFKYMLKLGQNGVGNKSQIRNIFKKSKF